MMMNSLNDTGKEVGPNVDHCFHSGYISGFPGGTTALTDCGDHQGFVSIIRATYKNRFQIFTNKTLQKTNL